VQCAAARPRPALPLPGRALQAPYLIITTPPILVSTRFAPRSMRHCIPWPHHGWPLPALLPRTSWGALVVVSPSFLGCLQCLASWRPLRCLSAAVQLLTGLRQTLAQRHVYPVAGLRSSLAPRHQRGLLVGDNHCAPRPSLRASQPLFLPRSNRARVCLRRNTARVSLLKEYPLWRTT
jgi:hypothetical protein